MFGKLKRFWDRSFVVPRYVREIKKASIVDSHWYSKNYSDIGESGVDPVKHFVEHGAREGRNPARVFDVNSVMSSAVSSGNKTLISFLEKHYNHRLKTISKQSKTDIPSLRIYDEVRYPIIDVDQSIRQSSYSKPVVIVIPVFNAFNELTLCLNSLVDSVLVNANVLLIDDASTSPGFIDIEKTYSKYGFHFIANDTNLGFSGTVNRGIREAKSINSQADIVLLNSDTIVSKYWLQELKFLAYSDSSIGTVTSVSNAAGPFSLVDWFDYEVSQSVIDHVGDILNKTAPLLSISLPTGHGFCMLLKRMQIEDVGEFDELAFPRGYGEENDFCMRAARRGWKHTVALRSFVYHHRNVSFGSEKDSLLIHGRKVVDQRYPDYTRLVSESFGNEDFTKLKHYIFDSLMSERNVDKFFKPRILFVISTETGGTPQTNRDLMEQLSDEFECFLLVSNSHLVKLSILLEGELSLIYEYNLTKSIEPNTHKSAEYDVVVGNWIAQLGIALIHIRHIAWHGLGLIDRCVGLNIPIVFSFHDFYTVCPTVKLLDGDKVYCGGRCTRSSRPCVPELWKIDQFTNLQNFEVYSWQRNFKNALNSVDHFVTTSESAKAVIQNVFPSITDSMFDVIPHGRDFSEFYDLSVFPKNVGKIRIVCPGNINVAKGLEFINKLAIEYSEFIEIHIVGIVSNEISLSENIVVHGPYERNDIHGIIRKIEPTVGGVFSIWPETWCHTLTELLSCGVPVFSFKGGAVEERILSGDLGWVLENREVGKLLEILADESFSKSWEEKKANVMLWQRREGRLLNTEKMGKGYKKIYRSLLDKNH